MFSHRTGWEFGSNALTEAVAARRRDGLPLSDWTLSNPTLAGLPYPERELLEALAHPDALRYDPEARGMHSAREAISRALQSVDGSTAPEAAHSPDAILLTASSSETYSHLFRLLADPGHEILIPTPGYPLFDDLARLNDVRTVPYRLRYDGAWHLDRESLRRGIGERTRAIVVVHPGNPTGSYFPAAEQEFIALLSAERGVPIIADEVFWSFHFGPAPPAASFLGIPAPLSFVIGGLSKLAGLPQLKLGWVIVTGEKKRKEEAMERLEMIADTYLSVNTPVQRALPEIFRLSTSLNRRIRERVSTNYSSLRAGCHGTPVTALNAEGGWNAVLRLPGNRTDEEWAIVLLREHGLLTHPGHYFELEDGTFLVVSLLLPEEEMERNLQLLLHSLPGD